VAMDNNIALIGSPFDDARGANTGAAFVTVRVDSDWSPLVELGRADPMTGDGFGRAVDVDGGRLAISVIAQRAADIWEQEPNGAWAPSATLQADDNEIGNSLGASIGISDDVVAVGAPKDDDRAGDAGAVYVFERDPNGNWTQAAELHAADGQAGDELGHSVAIDGDRIIAGAWVDDDLGFASGSAYIFERDPNGNWTQAAKLLASDGAPLDRFGISVAIRGDYAIVGATCADGAAEVSGAAYVFERGPSGWVERQKLFSPDGNIGEFFGWSVAMDGDMAIVGAARHDCESEILAGAAYVYGRQSDGLWALQGVLQAEDCQERDEFGYSVALSGNTAVVGAWLDDDVAPDGGSAYIFAVGPDHDGDGVMDVCVCAGDLTGDNQVDLTDLSIQLSNFGKSAGAAAEQGDLDGDGDVDLADLSLMLANFGAICF